LAVISRAYYWTAAAVQKLNNGDDVDDILTALNAVTDSPLSGPYKQLADLYKFVVMGTKQRM